MRNQGDGRVKIGKVGTKARRRNGDENTFRECLKSGARWSAGSLLITVPIGLYSRDWRPVAFAIAIIMPLTVFLVAATAGTYTLRMTAATLFFSVTIIALSGSVGYGLYKIVNYTPPCRPSDDGSCRYFLNGRDTGPATESDVSNVAFNQYGDFVFVGGAPLIFMVITAAQFYRRNRRAQHTLKG